MAKNTYDLEQPIMECWTVVDNLKTVVDGIDRKELTIDQIHTILNGLAVLYNIKFNGLFNNLEEVIKYNSVKDNG